MNNKIERDDPERLGVDVIENKYRQNFPLNADYDEVYKIRAKRI